MVWTSEGDDVVFYGLLCQKGSQQIIMIKHAGSWDMLHLPLHFSPKKTNISCHSSTSSEWESDVSIGVLFKNLFVNMTSINQLEHEEAVETFDAEPWAQQLDLSGKSDLNNMNRTLRIG